MDKEQIYLAAVEAYNDASTEDKFVELKKTFESLGDYEKAASYVDKCNKILEYSIGNTVKFGNYEGKELEWKVLAMKGRERLLFMTTGIPGITYDSERENTFWRDCSLRRWLNGQFLKDAFSLKEQMNIIFTNLKNHPSYAWGTDSGPATKDKIYAFSIDEVKEYLPNQEDRATGEWWWLRTLGHCRLAASTVYIDGSIYDIGINIVDEGVTVRPAMWVRLPR